MLARQLDFLLFIHLFIVKVGTFHWFKIITILNVVF